jgi:hypothetical protein
MIARMTGKAPLLLASFLFGVGVTGLVITTAERAEWGPFQPRSRTPEARVVVVDVRPEITPPPLLELFTSYPGEVAAETAAQVQAPASEPAAPEPTPTPVPPLRVYGIASDDAGVSAAGATPIPPPPIRIGNIASDAEPEPTPDESPTPEDQAEPQPQTGCTACGGADPPAGEDAETGLTLAAGQSGHAIPGNANGLRRRAEVGESDPGGQPGRGPRDR